MPVFDACVGAVAVFFTQPAQAIYTVLPNNVALLGFQFLGVLAITRSQTPRPVRLALFVTCMWAGLALECNLTPVASVFDAGHEALASVAPLVQSPAVGGALAALNTLVVWGGMGLGLYGGIVEDEWAFAVKGLACLGMPPADRLRLSPAHHSQSLAIGEVSLRLRSARRAAAPLAGHHARGRPRPHPRFVRECGAAVRDLAEERLDRLRRRRALEAAAREGDGAELDEERDER